MGMFSSLSSILDHDYRSDREVTQAQNDLEAMHGAESISDYQYESTSDFLEDVAEEFEKSEEET